MLNLIKLFTSIVAIVLFFALPAKAGDMSSMPTLGLSLLPTGTTQPLVTQTGADTFEIASEDLPAAMSNGIEFTATATVTGGSGQVVNSLQVFDGMTSPAENVGTPTATQVTVISVDQVPSDGMAQTYSIAAEADFGFPFSTVTATRASSESPSVSEATTACMSYFGRCLRTEITLTVLPLEEVTDNTAGLVNNFVRNRAGNIAAAEPDISNFLDDNAAPGTGQSFAFAINESSDKTVVDFGVSLAGLLPGSGTYPADIVVGEALTTPLPSPNKFNVWAKGTIAKSKRETERQDFGILHLGADYRLNSNALIGVIAQFDWADETYTNSAGNVSGNGWMVGPYAVIRLMDDVILDGRFAYGQSDNDISPIGTYTDSFDTERWLVHGRVTGSYDMDPWVIEPQISVLYIEETQKSYVDSLNVVIPEQLIALGQVEFGPKVTGKFDLGNGFMARPTVGLKGVWEFRDTGFVNLASGVNARSGGEGFFGRANAGIAFTNESINLEFGGFYDGIGQGDFEAYGGSAKLRVSF